MPATPDVKSGPRFDRTATAILDAAARVLSEQGSGANLAAVASEAGVSRATLYRYYPSREAVLEALADHALVEAAGRLADAGLERATVDDAIERMMRALVAVGDRYAVLAGEHFKHGDAKKEQIEAPMRAVFERGVETGALRQDLPIDVLLALFGGAILAALKLTQSEQLGVEEASAAAATVFLDGARPR